MVSGLVRWRPTSRVFGKVRPSMSALRSTSFRQRLEMSKFVRPPIVDGATMLTPEAVGAAELRRWVGTDRLSRRSQVRSKTSYDSNEEMVAPIIPFSMTLSFQFKSLRTSAFSDFA